MKLAEKILAMLKERRNKAITAEEKAKYEFDTADKAWEATEAAKYRSNTRAEFETLSDKAAFLEGAVRVKKEQYEFSQGERFALERAIWEAEMLLEIEKRLERSTEAAEKYWEHITADDDEEEAV